MKFRAEQIARLHWASLRLSVPFKCFLGFMMPVKRPSARQIGLRSGRINLPSLISSSGSAGSLVGDVWSAIKTA